VTRAAGQHRASTNGAPDDPPAEVAAIQADIERTRADLARTVDQLAAKLDVKARVRRRLLDVRDDAAYQVRTARGLLLDERGRPTTVVVAVGSGVLVVATAAATVWWRGRRVRRTRGWWRR
jgi:uncharacterized protein DUF3618